MQYKLARKIIEKDCFNLKEIEYVAGIDQAFRGDEIISSAVLLKFPELRIVDSNHTIERVDFPYIPTYLMFREGKPAVRTLKDLLRKNTIIFVDGSGICHPRYFGLACYVGLALNTPTIGITKTRLVGDYTHPDKVFQWEPIMYQGKEVGRAIKTCKRCREILVSVGHMISLDTAIHLTKSCIRDRKLPEPIRLAHESVSKLKKIL